jgi:dipeptidyl-peptidase-4
MKRFARSSVVRRLFVACVLGWAAPAQAQWLPFSKLPRADQVRDAQRAGSAIERGGRIREVRWALDRGEVLVRTNEGWKAVPIAGGERRAVEGDADGASSLAGPPTRKLAAPARGRQRPVETSPDGAFEARYRDGNLFLKPRDGDEVQITFEGDGKLKFGSASWVYGEELDQTTAMWWSPDGAKLAFYRFDDRPVKEFHLVSGWTTRTNSIMTEAYPKPGQPNPIAALMVLDVATRTITEIDVGPSTEQYIYEVEWTPDSKGLLFRRTPRRQDVLELVLADPATGSTRVVLTERQATWQENSPEHHWLADGDRFVWESEATGFSQYQLWSLSKGKLADLTRGEFPVDGVVAIDEAGGALWYRARSSETKINPQVHRAALDGSDGGVRLTGEDLHFSAVRIAPDGSAFVATSEFVDRPPSTRLFRVAGGRAEPVATLAEADPDPWSKAKLTKPEFLRLKAADGTTELYGILWKPADFDPSKKYPLVVAAYGGPFFAMVSSRLAQPKPEAEFGVLIATVDNRGTPGRGKAFEEANYLSLGEEDADDQAAIARQLAERPYVDGERIGITGHSYGGFMTIIAMLRYPDVFKVGVAGAPPTDWRQYDTIYTERYMRTPEENPKGYDDFSCVKLADRLKGRLMLLHGMVDDNVHPNNTFELAHALQSKNIPFEMMLFPKSDHGIFSPAEQSVTWSFLLEHLGVLDAQSGNGGSTQ